MLNDIEIINQKFNQLHTKIYQMFEKFEERLDILEKHNDEIFVKIGKKIEELKSPNDTKIQELKDEMSNFIKIKKGEVIDEFLKDVVETDSRMDAIEKRIFKR